MSRIRVAAAVLNQTPLDWDGNRHRISAAIQAARDAGAGVLCLPELCISGYGCEDMFLSPGVWRTSRDVLLDLLPETEGMVVSLGLPVFHGNGVYNTVAMAVDGRIAGYIAKQHLAGDGLHYEPRWFRAWPEGLAATAETAVGGEPIGDLLFDVSGVRIGCEICEDAWIASRPGSRLAHCGVDVLLNPSASHFAFGKHRVRRRFVLEGSRAFGTTYVYANLIGNESGRAIYGGGSLIATGGRMVAVGERFSFSDFEVTTAVVDIGLTQAAQARTHGLRSDPTGKSVGRIVSVNFCIPTVSSATTVPIDDDGDADEFAHSREEEFTRAISLGLFDYLRKSRSSGFVVSMSGGADSSAVACLVRTMVDLAVNEIGMPGFKQKLHYIRAIERCQNADDVMKRLLTGVYQSTVNSSETTRRAAMEVAHAVGADFMELDVESLVSQYVSKVSEAIGRELTWEQDDITLQNIQARVRAPGVWMLANIRGALLLSTSNRSEAAVGYATMDGDTSGGLSPIAGIDKAFLRQWLKWMETTGPDGGSSVPQLSFVNVQQPTAELRPPGAHQTDESDLMPYPLLDAIERAAIRDKLMPEEILSLMRERFTEYSTEQLTLWIKRFFRLWSRNQWKRERYAPSFHVDDENLDPKSWCRFPILSGGFERELRELP